MSTEHVTVTAKRLPSGKYRFTACYQGEETVVVKAAASFYRYVVMVKREGAQPGYFRRSNSLAAAMAAAEQAKALGRFVLVEVVEVRDPDAEVLAVG